MFDIYPKRIGQVLLVGAPLVFQPLWQVVKPLLGKYSGIVHFSSPDEAERWGGLQTKVAT
jgi:CRAL/TRIO domain